MAASWFGDKYSDEKLVGNSEHAPSSPRRVFDKLGG
jgi:hypothetical protein